jgi:hypothetical protein
MGAVPAVPSHGCAYNELQAGLALDDTFARVRKCRGIWVELQQADKGVVHASTDRVQHRETPANTRSCSPSASQGLG